MRPPHSGKEEEELHDRTERGETMNQWNKHRFSLLFSGATTRDPCVTDSQSLHSVIEVSAFIIYYSMKNIK